MTKTGKKSRKRSVINTHISFVLLGYLLLLPCLNAAAQSPYSLNWGRESGLVGGSVIGIGTSIILKKNKPILTPSQITAAMANPQCPQFECFVTHNWDTKAQHFSDVLLWGSMAVPLVLLASPNIRKDAVTSGTIGIETYLVTGALTNLTKELFRRKRPFVYNPNAPLSLKMKADATSSFFSGHTSYTASACFLTAKMYNDYYPNSKLRPYIWTAAALVPAIQAYARVKGGKHFVTDVITGYIIGATVGILIPELHRIR